MKKIRKQGLSVLHRGILSAVSLGYNPAEIREALADMYISQSQISRALEDLKEYAQTTSYDNPPDLLLKLLAQRKQMTMEEVALEFEISTKEAKEWALVLRRHGLIDVCYPLLGSPKIQFKEELK